MLIVAISVLSGCGRNLETAEDLTYRSGKDTNHTIYIEEDGRYEPYLVLTSDYGGQTLLLRKYLLSDTMPYNENESNLWAADDYGAYYETSSIDDYLNRVFFDSLGQSVKDVMVTSNIMITAKESLGRTGEIATTINRKVFLLSLMEVTGKERSTSVEEGTALKYFEGDYDRKVAETIDGVKYAYWVRTPETWETYTVYTIGPRGLGMGSAAISCGIRPAFCIEKTARIVQRDDIVEEGPVYVLEEKSE